MDHAGSCPVMLEDYQPDTMVEEKINERKNMKEYVTIDYSSLKKDMIDTIEFLELDLSKAARKTLTSFESLISFVTADLEEGKTARFMEGNPGFTMWPSLTLCTHEGALYQLWSTTALVGGDPNGDPNEDRQKVWVKVREI